MVLEVGEVSKEEIFDYGRNYMIIFAFKNYSDWLYWIGVQKECE